MYSIAAYGAMIMDHTRTDAYCAALRGAVRPDSVVLDIGAGTGIFALYACELGARHVYAVEPSEAVELLRESTRACGYTERITVLQGLSTAVSLPERADVIVSDLRGTVPLHDRHLEAIVDARNRHLAPEGVLIPRRDKLYVAVVESPGDYRVCDEPWTTKPNGLDLSAARPLVVNQWRGGHYREDQVLTAPKVWHTLDYETVTDPNASANVAWTMDRSGTGHGLGIWFDAELAPGIGYSTAPGGPPLVYGRAFFPWQQAVQLEPGDVVTVDLAAHLVGEDYIWRWDTRIDSTSGVARAEFRQSTLLGMPLSLTSLRRRATTHRPTLSANGQLLMVALELMDGDRSIADLAGDLARRFPDRFASNQAAVDYVADLSARYGG